MTDKDRLAEALKKAKHSGHRINFLIHPDDKWILDTLIESATRAELLEGDLSICQLRLDAKHTAITSKREAELEARVKELEEENKEYIRMHSEECNRYVFSQKENAKLRAKLEAAKGVREAAYGLLDGRNLGRTIYGWHELQEALAAYDSVEENEG